MSETTTPSEHCCPAPSVSWCLAPSEPCYLAPSEPWWPTQAEQASRSILCPSVGDHLQTASSCYRRAIALHGGDSAASSREDGSDDGSAMDDDGQSADDRLTAASLTLELATVRDRLYWITFALVRSRRSKVTITTFSWDYLTSTCWTVAKQILDEHLEV